MRHSSIKAKGATADVLIYEDIGEGFFGGLGAKAFRETLTALSGDVTSLNVRINSGGGDVFEGMAIYNTLKSHPAKKNVIIDGIAASMASVIAMAGDTITIQPTAVLMIHNAHGTFRGDCNALRSGADLLEMINGQMAVAYARSGKSTDEIRAVMNGTKEKPDTWLTAQEAVDAGWVDSVVAEPLKMAASIKDVDLSGYANVPDYVKEAQLVSAQNDTGCVCDCTPCLGGDCKACEHTGCDCEGCSCEWEMDAKAPKINEITAKTPEIQQNALINARFRERSLRLAENS